MPAPRQSPEWPHGSWPASRWMTRISAEWSRPPSPCARAAPVSWARTAPTGVTTPGLAGRRGEDGQVLVVQLDAEAGGEVARQHRGRLPGQHRAARQASLQDGDGRLHVHALGLKEHQRLGHQRDVARHDELVRGLDGLPGARRADVQDGAPHGLQHGPGRRDVNGRAADHDRQCPVDRAALTAADRCVEAAQPAPDAGRRHPAGHVGPDRAHVDVQRSGRRAGHDAVRPERDGLDVWGVRQHGDDRVRVPHRGGHAAGPPASRGEQSVGRLPAAGVPDVRRTPP